MAIYILRPNDIGHYNTVWDIVSTSGWTTYWENLNEKNQDGDANYVYTSTPGAFTVRLSDFSHGSFVRPDRVHSVGFIATVKPDNPNPTTFRFRLRYLGIDYDSDLFTISSTDYIEVAHYYNQMPNGDGWNAVRLSDVEVGLVYESGQELRCTKIEAQVSTELYPHCTLVPLAAGAHQDWGLHPSTVPPHMTVNSFDGDQSYCWSDTLWEQADTSSTYTLRGVFGLSTSSVYAVGDYGTILRFDGSRWWKDMSTTTSNLYGVWGSDAFNIWAVGQAGTILKWNGHVWAAEDPGVTDDILAVWGTASNDVFAVGSNGLALHYDGVAWSVMVTGTTEYLFSISGSSTANVFAVGSNGAILWWNGLVWAVIPPVTVNDLYGVSVVSPLDAFAVGKVGTTLHYNGAVWLPVVSPTLQALRAVWGYSPVNYIAVGDLGTVLRWDGALWETLDPDSTSDLYGVWGATSYRVFTVGVAGTLLSHHDIAWHPMSTFTVWPLPAILTPPNIDRVTAVCLVKNQATAVGTVSTVLRSVGVDYLGATGTAGVPVPADNKWHAIEEVYFNDPATGWPSGVPAATPWTPLEVNSLEIGIFNYSGDLRCTSMGLDVFLKHTPLASFTLVPVADGYYHATVRPNRIPTLFPGAGESAWQDVMDDPPDFGATYIEGDATAAGFPLYGTFPVTPLPGIPPGQQVYCCRHRIWMALPVGSTGAIVAPAFRFNNETYVGRPYTVSNTGLAWFLIRNDFFTSPFTSQPWSIPELNLLEVGVVILSGHAQVTSVNVEVHTAPLLQIPVLPPDPTDLQLTNGAITIMNRSKLDGTIYAVTEFAVGTGGFNPATPWVVVPVNPADVALAGEIYRAKIQKIAYDADTPPWKVKYWCRVPRTAPADVVGEIGLFATILWSPFPAEIGTQFLFALQHMPCQCRHDKMVQVFEVSVEYP